MRFGKAHRAGPYPFHQFRQVQRANFLGGAGGEQVISAVAQLGIQLERKIRGCQHLIDQVADQLGQSLTAMLWCGIDAGPAILDKLLIRLFETRRRRHSPIDKYGAMFVTVPVDRQNHRAAKFPCLLENGFQDIFVEFLEAR